jgi:DNA repair protein RadC
MPGPDQGTIKGVAVVLGANAVIVAHNHPSGDTTPSAEDIEITRKISEAGKVLGVELLDHVIVADDAAAFSFCDRGLLVKS